MGSRIMKDGRLGRYQYLEDPNWTSEPYVLDYETSERYYPSYGMNALVEILNRQDKKIHELERDYELGVETKLYSRRKLEQNVIDLEKDKCKLEKDIDNLVRINRDLKFRLKKQENILDVDAELDALIAYNESKIHLLEYSHLKSTACKIKEYRHKNNALKEFKSKINKRNY